MICSHYPVLMLMMTLAAGAPASLRFGGQMRRTRMILLGAAVPLQCLIISVLTFVYIILYTGETVSIREDDRDKSSSFMFLWCKLGFTTLERTIRSLRLPLLQSKRNIEMKIELIVIFFTLGTTLLDLT